MLKIGRESGYTTDEIEALASQRYGVERPRLMSPDNYYDFCLFLSQHKKELRAG